MSYQPSKEEILQKAQRILKLSERPPNPGFAYRHLEHIHALSQKLLEDLIALGVDDTEAYLVDPLLPSLDEHRSKRVS